MGHKPKGKITYISKRHTETAHDNLRYSTTKGSIQISAQSIQTSGGIKFSKNEIVKIRDFLSPEVEEIKLLSPLTDGCDWRPGGALREGMIYGNTYTFEAVKFRNNVTPAPNDICWSYRYEGENGVVERDIPNHGKTLSLEVLDLDVCGRGLTIRAYVKDRHNKAVYNGWVHYRFRWFSREKVLGEIDDRLNKSDLSKGPQLVDQNHTPLCGMACIAYLLADNDPANYKRLVKLLHQKGEASHNSYIVRAKTASMYDMSPDSDTYPAFRKYSNGNKRDPPDYMPLVDWMLLATMRSSQSNFGYKGHDDQEASGINTASNVIELLSSLLGYKDVTDNTMADKVGSLFDWLHHLVAIQKRFQDGYKVCILIDSDMLNDSPSWWFPADNPFSWRYHWIVYEGNMMVNEENKTYSFSYWCWGKKRRGTFKKDSFNTNYYGYVQAR